MGKGVISKSRAQEPSNAVGAHAVASGSGGPGREYLYIEQLAELTPWTEDAIRTMMSRGKLNRGTHYFKPYGAHSRPIFKWSAIVQLIEGGGELEASDETIPLAGGMVINLDEATNQISKLLN